MSEALGLSPGTGIGVGKEGKAVGEQTRRGEWTWEYFDELYQVRLNTGRKKDPRDLERMLLNYWPFLSTAKVFLSCGCLEVSGRKHQRAVSV